MINQYLNILRSAIWGKETSMVSSIDYNQVIRLAQIQGTGPLCYNELLKIPKGEGGLTSVNDGEDGMNDAIRMQLKQVCMQNMLLQQRWSHVIEQVWTALQPLSVKPVLLKGFALAELYPLPYLRAWGDLDVWVGIDDYHKTCELLRATFPDAEHNEEEDEDFKHYCFVLPDGATIEVHRVTMEFASRADWEYYHGLEQEGMIGGPSFRVGNTEVYSPKDDFNLLFVFLHAWEHFTTSGMSMKLVADMTLLAHYVYGIESESVRKEIEDYLRPALKRLHVWEVWQMVGYVAIHTLNLPENEWPLYTEETKEEGRREKDGERLMAKILEEGQSRKRTIAFGAKTQEEAAEIARHLPVLKRKWITLVSRWNSYKDLRVYAPEYAWHELKANLWRGIDRTIHRKAMAKYF